MEHVFSNRLSENIKLQNQPTKLTILADVIICRGYGPYMPAHAIVSAINCEGGHKHAGEKVLDLPAIHWYTYRD